MLINSYVHRTFSRELNASKFQCRRKFVVSREQLLQTHLSEVVWVRYTQVRLGFVRSPENCGYEVPGLVGAAVTIQFFQTFP